MHGTTNFCNFTLRRLAAAHRSTIKGDIVVLRKELTPLLELCLQNEIWLLNDSSENQKNSNERGYNLRIGKHEKGKEIQNTLGP